MTPPMSDHGRVQMNLAFALRTLIGGMPGLEVFGEIGIRLGDHTVIGADAAIVRARDQANRMLDPDEIVLAVEVSNGTLSRDLGAKRTAYAEAGVADYWMIDVGRRMIHRFTKPTDGEYFALASLRFGEPLPVPGTSGTIVVD